MQCFFFHFKAHFKYFSAEKLQHLPPPCISLFYFFASPLLEPNKDTSSNKTLFYCNFSTSQQLTQTHLALKAVV